MRSTGSSRSGSSRSRRETGNPRTVGRRYDPRALTDVLVRAAGDVRLAAAVRARRRSSRPAASARGWRASAGCCCGRTRGARATGSRTRVARGAADDRGDGRVLRPRDARPRWPEERLRARLAALRASRARARRRGSRPRRRGLARERPRPALSRRARRGTSSMRGRCASRCGSGRSPTSSRWLARRAATCGRPDELPFALPASPKLVEPPFLAVRVYAAVTHTIGGLRIDDRARVLDARRRAGRGPLRRGRRRGRHLHRRLRQRPRGRARLRPASPPRPARWRLDVRRAACTRSGGGRPGAATGRSC